MLSGQGKVATHLVPREDNVPSLTEFQGSPGEENREAADEIHLPDYVMHDFGFPRGSHGDR